MGAVFASSFGAIVSADHSPRLAEDSEEPAKSPRQTPRHRLPARADLDLAVALEAIADPLHVRQGRGRAVVDGEEAGGRGVVVLAGVDGAPEGDGLDGAEAVEVVKGWRGRRL